MSRVRSVSLEKEDILQASQVVDDKRQTYKDEQERVQKKTFTNWINSYLCNYDPPSKVTELFNDIKNGVMLLQLLEVLSGEKLPHERTKHLQRVHFLNNIRTSLDFLESKKIKLVNINPSDIADGKPSIVLGLVWTIILYFQIEENSAAALAGLDLQDGDSSLQRFKMTAKKALLVWAEKAVTDKSGVPVKDFGKSWRDGVAFNALVHNVRPDIVDMDEVHRRSNRENLEDAFSKAERHLGIPRLLDPEDVDMDKPDEKSIMTYVAQFMKAYPDPDNPDPKVPVLTEETSCLKSLHQFMLMHPFLDGDRRIKCPKLNSEADEKMAAEAERQLYNEVLSWLDQTDGKLDMAKQPITDPAAEYEDLMKLKGEQAQYREGVDRLKQLYDSGSALVIDKEKSDYLNGRWDETNKQIKAWQDKLDRALPGKCGDIAEWLLKAEQLIYDDVVPKDISDNNEIAEILKGKVGTHKALFKDADSIRRAFNQIKQKGEVDGKKIPKQQLDDIGKRISKVVLAAPHILRKMEYEESRHRLLGLLDQTDDKVKDWGGKVGRQDDVDDMLNDCNDYIKNQKLFETFDKAFGDCKNKSEAQKKSFDPNDTDSIQAVDSFLEEVKDQWDPLKVEVQSCQTSLDKTSQYWKRYLSCDDMLQVWLSDAEKKLSASLEERNKFFEDFPQFQEKHKMLNEAGNYLIDVCEPPIANEIKQNLLFVNKRFKDGTEQLESVHKKEVADKAREEYKFGVDNISDWLEDVEALLEKTIPCSYPQIKELLHALEKAQSEVEGIQTDFKTMSKIGQSLVKESSQETINEMLGTLKVIKERIIKVQKEVPDRVKGLKNMLPQVESLETGISDISHWLDNAEAVLVGNSPDSSNIESIADKLEKHKALFSETTYYKSMLEGKNKVFQKMQRAGVKNVDTAEMEQTFNDLKERFQHVLFHAPIRQMKLEFAEPEETFLHNLETAEKLLNEQQAEIDKHGDLAPIKQKHQEVFHDSEFFPTSEKCLNDMKVICDSLKRYYPEDPSLQEAYDEYLDRWHVVGRNIDCVNTYLQEMPAQWNEYNERLDHFTDWMSDVEKQIQDLDDETDSASDYKQKVTKYDDLVTDIDQRREDVKWLVDALDDLLQDYSEADARAPQEKLEDVIARYKLLMPEIESTDEKTKVKLACYQWRDVMNKKMPWLADIKAKVSEPERPDDINKLKRTIKDYEKLCSKIDDEGRVLEDVIAEGKVLQAHDSATAFMPECVDTLDQEWTDVSQAAMDKNAKLLEVLQKWEDYESSKKKMQDNLKVAETEANKSATNSGPEALRKEMQNKERQLLQLQELEPVMTEVKTLNVELSADTGDRAKEFLAKELDNIDTRYNAVTKQLESRVQSLDDMDKDHEDFQKRLEEFNSVMDDQEDRLNKALDPKLSPEMQYAQAQDVLREIEDQGAVLDELEQKAKDLSSNYSAREAAPLKNKIANLRKQYNNLLSQTAGKTDVLSSNVNHFNQYQNRLDELQPWMDKANKYLQGELRKCDNIDDALEIYQTHEEFLKERDEFSNIFESLIDEANQITDQPNIASEIQKLKRKWNNIMSSSDDKGARIDRMHAQWKAYSVDMKEAKGTLEEFEDKLSEDPDYDSIQLPVLEEQLLEYKMIQAQLQKEQPTLNAALKSSQVLRSTTTPEGLQALADEQGDLKKEWSDVGANINDRIKKLQEKIDEKKDMYSRLEDANNFLGRIQEKLDLTKDIKADEVKGNKNKILGMKEDIKRRRPEIEKLITDMEAMLPNLPPEEQEILKEKIEKLKDALKDADDQVKARDVLCDKWTEYHDTHKKAEDRLKELVRKIESNEIRKEDIPAVQAEIEELKKVLGQWGEQSDELDDLMGIAKQKITDPDSKQSLGFKLRIEDMLTKVDDVSNKLQQKEQHLDEVDGKVKDSEQISENMLMWLRAQGKNIDDMKLAQPVTPEKIAAFKEFMKNIGGELDMNNPQLEALRQQAKDLEATDPEKAAQIRALVEAVEKEIKHVQDKAKEKENQADAVHSLWREFDESDDELQEALKDVEELMNLDLSLASPEEVQAALEKFKKAEQVMAKHKVKLESLNAKGAQLMAEGGNLPAFTTDQIQAKLLSVNDKFAEMTKKLAASRENLGEQKDHWDEITNKKDEVNTWLENTIGKLEEGAQHFDDSTSMEAKLAKYKTDLPQMQSMREKIKAEIKRLEELGGSEEQIAALRAIEKDLDKQFEKAQEAAIDLEGKVDDYNSRKDNIQDNMDAVQQRIIAARDELAKLDDLSGDDKDIAERLQAARKIREALKRDEDQMEELQKELADLNVEYNKSPEVSAMVKDGNILSKKYDNALERAGKVETNLEKALEHQHQEAIQDQQRWLNTAKEKVQWCSDISGDKYSIEAKLATINELIAGLDEGEMKTKLIGDKTELLRSLLPPDKQHLIDEMCAGSQDAWEEFKQTLSQTKNKLEDALDQWKDYDDLNENLSQWLKDTEMNIRSESNLKPDLKTKKDQLDKFKVINEDVQKHQAEVTNALNQAQKISGSTGDPKVANYANQLNSRYDNLKGSAKDFLDRFEKNVDDHEMYTKKYQEAADCIHSLKDYLSNTKDTTGDREDVQHRMELIKEMVANKDACLTLVNSAVEAGEKLYPGTASEGREIIRQELRTLRDAWENYSDDLNEAQRDIDSCLLQWTSYDEGHEQLSKWVAEMEKSQSTVLDPKATLAEKKAALLHYRNLGQDIVAHENMLDGIVDKAQTLSSPNAAGKIADLKSRYQKLYDNSKDQVQKCEETVGQHQAYQDSLQNARDWLHSGQDRLDTCHESSGDKHSLQNKADRIQDLLDSCDDGKAKVEEACIKGEKVLATCSEPGRVAVRKELDTLQKDFDEFVNETVETKAQVNKVLSGMEDYDENFNFLSHWMRDMEAEIRDYELKSTADEKKNQVNKFMDLQENINQKQVKFDALADQAENLRSSETRLVTYASQLNTRYHLLKTNIKDVISKWENYSTEHENYDKTYDTTCTWLENMKERLKGCSEISGDKNVMENRQGKLQQLILERDSEIHQIHNTVEAGERLYPNTAAPGRETIRQDLRTLRENWDAFCDQLSENQRKLDVCVQQWSSYDESYEQFNKWAQERTEKMKVNEEKKATLPEKKIQLQNHKVLHQDILSHHHIVDSLTDKAHNLTQSTADPRIKELANKITKQYENLCNDSKALYHGYEVNVTEHQAYQDSLQDCQECLNVLLERANACCDTSGDKHTVQIRLDRIKDIYAMKEESDSKLQSLKRCSAKINPNTSPEGREILKKDETNLETEMSSCLDVLTDARDRLEKVLELWEVYEENYDSLSQWIKAMEHKTREFEPVSTLKEKEDQCQKMKALQTEIINYQDVVDKFTDKAASLMGVTSDTRLQTYVNQLNNRYQALLTNMKDQIKKGDQHVQEHMQYETNHNDFVDWLTSAEEKLDDCADTTGDKEAIEEKQAVVQRLQAEKEIGLSKLNSAVEFGEKLYPDTASPGRDKIRQDLRTAKEDWDHLLNSMNDAQRKFESFLNQLENYSETQEQLLKWISDTEYVLQSELEPKNTLAEKREQLHTHRAILQDINSHHRVVESAVEKAQSLQQGAPSAKLSKFIKDVSTRYEGLKTSAKDMIMKSEKNVQNHQQYHDTYQIATDWLSLMKDRSNLCNDVTGDKHTIQNRIERLQDLTKGRTDGEEKVDYCVQIAEMTMVHTAPVGRQVVSKEVTALKQDWDDYNTSLTDTQKKLDNCMQQWRSYDDNYDRLSHWIKEMEKKVKDFGLKNTLEEKHVQLEKFQALNSEVVDFQPTFDSTIEQFFKGDTYMQSIRGRHSDFEEFNDQVQALSQITSESRVASQVSQLQSRYQTLQVTVKEILKKCEQNVADTELYKDRYADCIAWMRNSKERAKECMEVAGSRTELESKQDHVRELLSDKENGFSKLNQTVEAGERLYPNTASEGRETIRQELRALKQDWENLFDELALSQRKLEASLIQWTSVDDSYVQLEEWMRNIDNQLKMDIILKATLEQKKAQLLSYKSLHQDVLSYQRVIDGVSEKAQALATNTSDDRMSSQLSQLRNRYVKLCENTQDFVKKYEEIVKSHVNYHDAQLECHDWITTMKERLAMCSDVSGDRHAVQSRLDRLQRMPDLANNKTDGEAKVNNVIILSQDVLPNTAPQGLDPIVKEVDSLKSDWETFKTSLSEAKVDLEKCVLLWKSYEDSYEHCSSWLKDMEHKLRDVELKPTLQEKQAQREKLQGLNDTIIEHIHEFNELTDRAGALVRIGGDNYVSSQAQQLNSRYQNLVVNAKELVRRWGQYVTDHVNYQETYTECKAWQDDFRNRLGSCVSVDGDRYEVESRLTQLQELSNLRDEGFRKLQSAADNMQVVLPNTAPSGRDNLRRDVQVVQHNWDADMTQMNENKTKMENCLTQLSMYDEGIDQFNKWLREMEANIKSESEPQATLQEKKAQLERVKILQLNINSHQATMNNLGEKASALQTATNDSNILAQVNQLNNRFDTLQRDAAELVRNCDGNVFEHQAYRDSYLDATEWVSTVKEKLVYCSDTRGDRHNIEAKQQKLEGLISAKSAGENKVETTLEKGEAVMAHTSSAGSDLIQEETRALRQDMDTFNNTIDEVQVNLDKLVHQWNDYEETYGDLNQWLKDMQASMKTDSDLKTTLREKKDYLKTQTEKHNEIIEHQTQFDALSEKAQSILHSSSDPKVSTQLSQLNARYSALVSLSKDLLKKCEQNVEDHSQYKESYAQCLEWLNETEDKLSICAETSGDRYSIQAQLESLQEFVVLKEEGQGMIHTTNTLGEKTMTNTSLEGRDIIRQELQALQRDWDEFTANISDTKIALETSLLKWTDFDDTRDQVDKWLKDMANKVKETEARADLGEKKVQLQKVKGLYQDVMSHQHMIDSLDGKSQDLDQNNPASHVGDDVSITKARYDALKKDVEDLVKKNEDTVEDHQKYQDSNIAFNTWLRGAQEKLASCSDVYGDKNAVLAKLDKIKALQAAADDGDDKLAKALIDGDAVARNSAPAGQSRLQQELGQMKHDFTNYNESLNGARGNLEDCLDCWNDYENAAADFNQWLDETGKLVKKDIEPQTNINDKEAQLEKYQKLHKDILAHQQQLDDVNKKAQALLETNADARISHNITQMTTKYQGLVSKSLENAKKLEGQYNDHQNYRDAMDEYDEWLADVKEKMERVKAPEGSKADVDAYLQNVRELQASLDQGHSKLRRANDYGDRLMPSTNAAGKRLVRDEIDGARNEYEKLKNGLSENKITLEQASTQWAEFDRGHEQMDTWLRDLEHKLERDPETKGDLADKKAQLDRYKALLQDIQSHKIPLDKLKEKLAELGGAEADEKIGNVDDRYGNLLQAVKDKINTLDGEITEQEKFKRDYQNALDWMSGARQQLTRLSEPSGDKDAVQAKINELKQFKQNCANERDRIGKVIEEAKKIMPTLPPHQQELLRKEIAQLQREYDELGANIDDAQHKLENNVLKWVDYNDEKTGFKHWLDEVEDALKTINDPHATLEEKQKKFRQIEALCDDIAAHKPDFDSLNEKSQAVLQNSLDPEISSEMMQISTRYQTALQTAKDAANKLEQSAKDHRGYDIAYADCAQWLESASDRLSKCNDTTGDWQEIEGRIDAVREINANLDDGHTKLSKATELAQKVMRNCSPEGKKKIQGMMDKLREAWDTLHGNINICSTNLEKSLLKYNEYEECYDLILKWMLDTENLLLADPERKVELLDKKQQLDKYKAIQTDINYHAKQIEDLTEVASQIQTTRPDKEVNKSIGEMTQNYDKLKKRSNEIVDQLQKAYDEHQDYHDTVQDTEKWILQKSFQVMSHNGLNVGSMELTEKQITKHAALMREIAAYQSNIDSVKKTANQLIKSNDRNPQLESSINSELDNLQDSYSALQATAGQIKDRLQDTLEKWQEYQKSLDKTEKFMDKDLAVWWVGKRRPQADSIEHAHIQMHESKEMLQKLQGMKQDLQAAANRCENTGSMEALDQVEVGLDSSVNRLADRVNFNLRDAHERVEDRVNGLNDLVKEWEDVNKMKSDFRDWLRTQQLELKDLEDCPAKLHSDAGELELAHMQALKDEIRSKERMLNNLLTKHKNLTQHDPSLRDPVIKALQEDYEELLGRVNNLMSKRRDALENGDAYNKKRGQVGRDVEELEAELERYRREEMIVAENADRLKAEARSSSSLNLHDTSTQTPHTSATQTQLSMLKRHRSSPDLEAELKKTEAGKQELGRSAKDPLYTSEQDILKKSGDSYSLGASLGPLGTLGSGYANRPASRGGYSSGDSYDRGPGGLRNSGDHTGISQQFWPYRSATDSKIPNRLLSPKRGTYGSDDTGLGRVTPSRDLLSSSPSPARFHSPGRAPLNEDYLSDFPNEIGVGTSGSLPHASYVNAEDIPTYDFSSQTIPFDNMASQTGRRLYRSSHGAQTDKKRRGLSPKSAADDNLGRKLEDMAEKVQSLKNSVDDLRASPLAKSTSPMINGSHGSGYKLYDDDNESSLWASDREPADSRNFAMQTPSNRRTQTPNHAGTQTKKKPWQRSKPWRKFQTTVDTTDAESDIGVSSRYVPSIHNIETQTPKRAYTQTPENVGVQTNVVGYMNSVDSSMQTPSNARTQTPNGRIKPHDIDPSRGTPRGRALKSLLDTIKNMNSDLAEQNKAAAEDSGFSSGETRKPFKPWMKKKPQNESLREPVNGRYNVEEDNPYKPLNTLPPSVPSRSRSTARYSPPTKDYESPNSRGYSASPMRVVTPPSSIKRRPGSAPRSSSASRLRPERESAPERDRPSIRSPLRPLADYEKYRPPPPRAGDYNYESDRTSTVSSPPPLGPIYTKAVPVFTPAPVYPVSPPQYFTPPPPSQRSSTLNLPRNVDSRDFVRDYNKPSRRPRSPYSPREKYDIVNHNLVSNIDHDLKNVSRKADELRRISERMKDTLSSEIITN
ncbi:muscle-specific protein 300 kDa-like isoform X3 [Tubulanus polymorphus]|uniref:muscle-specific protein 300 kDa-like isoform X3 n=1 Tax=Tubulanus polymorphus TaxID=672921 RepID=UPI003DA4C909